MTRSTVAETPPTLTLNALAGGRLSLSERLGEIQVNIYASRSHAGDIEFRRAV